MLCTSYFFIAKKVNKVSQCYKKVHYSYKYSNADSGVIFKFLQNPLIVMAVCTKISKKICILDNILTFLRENKKVSFLLFWIFKLKQSFFNQSSAYFDVWIFNCQICITVLNYTVQKILKTINVLFEIKN